MPWMVKKFPDGWYVVNKSTGEKKNNEAYQAKDKAEAYLRALYANAGAEAMKNEQ